MKSKLNTILLITIIILLLGVIWIQWNDRRAEEGRDLGQKTEQKKDSDEIGKAPVPTMKFCPDVKIVNQMPYPCDGDCSNRPPNEYYIYKGERYEIFSLDATWVKNNCTVKEEVVY